MDAIVSPFFTVTVNERVAAPLSASVTFAFTVDTPADVGVPVMRPLDEIDIHDGLLSREYVYGVRPPDAVTWMAVMATPTVAVTSGMDAIVSPFFTVTVNERFAVFLFASVTFTFTVDTPADVGVPVIRPLEEIDIHDGLLSSEYVYGVRPPDAVTWMAVMATPTVAVTFEIVPIVRV